MKIYLFLKFTDFFCSSIANSGPVSTYVLLAVLAVLVPGAWVGHVMRVVWEAAWIRGHPGGDVLRRPGGRRLCQRVHGLRMVALEFGNERLKTC